MHELVTRLGENGNIKRPADGALQGVRFRMLTINPWKRRGAEG
jgi:hypothetical protein